MKQVLLMLVMLGCSLCRSYAQEQKPGKDPVDTLAPYRKYPSLPAFNVLKMDSSTIFNTYNIPKGRPVVLFFFSPDCSHCKRMTDEILKKMDSLKHVDFYMITPMSKMSEIKKFYAEHELAKYENVKLVGRDYEFFFGSFYKINVVPDLALYDAQKKLIKLVQGEAPVSLVIEAMLER